jgi:hypothetical protein
MSTEAQWVRLAEFTTVFEADLLRNALEEARIPVLVRGPQAGFYGAGFQGTVIGGLEVHVPSQALERAREILEDGVGPEAT